jgi:hypothetical protein
MIKKLDLEDICGQMEAALLVPCKRLRTKVSMLTEFTYMTMKIFM